MPVSEQLYKQVALEDPSGQWELVCGRLQSKPGMTIEHESSMSGLARQLILQLDEQEYDVRMNGPRVRISTGTYFLPDVGVISRAFVERKRRDQPRELEVYEEPLPLIVEVWSPSTREYDVEEKLREYQSRGDLEIWYIHPYEKTLTRWQIQPDGSFQESLIRAGSARPVALPSVEIEIASLFD